MSYLHALIMFFFLELTLPTCVPQTLTYLPLIPPMYLVCPCLRSQPWFEVNLYTVGPSGDLSTSSHGSQYESPHTWLLFFIIWTFVHISVSNAGPPCFPIGFHTEILLSTLAHARLAPSEEDSWTNLPIPQGSSQIIFFPVKLLGTLTF